MSIKVDYEQCKWNGKHKHYEHEIFLSLEELADWLFDMMRVNYTEDVGSMGFYMIEEYKNAVTANKDAAGNEKTLPIGIYPYAMEFKADDSDKELLAIHKITSGPGTYNEIIFSDGVMTAGQKFWNKEVKDWMRKCYERQMHPKFNFAYDDEDSNANNKQMA